MRGCGWGKPGLILIGLAQPFIFGEWLGGIWCIHMQGVARENGCVTSQTTGREAFFSIVEINQRHKRHLDALGIALFLFA